MAKNNEELDRIKQIRSAEQLLETIEGKADPFAGYSLDELRAILGVVSGFDNTNAKEAILSMLNTEITAKLDKEINNESNTQQPAQSESQNQQPSPADSRDSQPMVSTSLPQEKDLPDLDFMLNSSYTTYKEFEEFFRKYQENAANPDADKDELNKQKQMVDLFVNNAKKIIDLAANDDEGITPEKAVFLKDYMEILNTAGYHNEKLQAEIEKQLAVFDEKNNLSALKSVPAQILADREDELYNIGNKYVKDLNNGKENTDVDEIIKHLVVQENKLYEDNRVDFVLEQLAQRYAEGSNKPKEKFLAYLQDIYTVGSTNESLPEGQKITLSADDQKLYDDIKVKIAEVGEDLDIQHFSEKFTELKNEIELTKAIERTKIIAEELYPEKAGMSPEELEAIRKKREEYLKEQLSREDGLPDQNAWAEENALRALRNKYSNLSDEELLKKYGKELSELKQAYTNVANEIDLAVNTSYVLRVEQLANRTARLTGASGINNNTQKFLDNYAENHKDSSVVGKMALSIGKSVALTQGIRYAFGFKGMAAYSAYKTGEAVNKSWAKYKESLQPGEKGSVIGYCAYLRKNPKELTDIASKVSKTAVMSTLAIAGTAMGIDNIPGVSAAIVGSINAVTAAVKIHQNKEAIKNTWKNRKQIIQDFKEKHPKLKKYGKWGAAIAGIAAAGYATYKIFAPDEVKDAVNEAIDEATNDLTKKPENLFENDSILNKQPIDKELDLGLGKDSVHIGMDAPKLDDVNTNITGNGGSDAADAAQAAAEVPALSEADVNLLKTDCKMGPDPIVVKLEKMGVLTAEDREKLIASGGRKDGIASRVLASYLGHPYDDTEVPVHANLTPEQQQELNQFLRSDEYQQECDKCKAAENVRRLAKVKQMADEKANGGSGNGTTTGGDGNAKSLHVEKLNAEEQTSTPTEHTFSVAQRKQYLFNLIHKSINPKDMSITLDEQAIKNNLATELQKAGYTPEEIQRQLNKVDIDKAAREMMADKYIAENNVKRVEIIDKDGAKHIYYQDKTNKAGELIEKQKDIDTDNHKTTEFRKTAENKAVYVKYKGKEEVYTFIDKNGKEIHIGSEDKDKILSKVEDPKTGMRTTLVKGDDGKKYTILTNMKTGHSEVHDGISKSAMKKIYEAAKSRS